MSDEKEKWIEEVFQSMQGSQRAKPRPELFTKIESQIAASKAKFVSMRQWRYAVAAAALVLLVNLAAVSYYNQDIRSSYEDTTSLDVYNQSLISTYQIYE